MTRNISTKGRWAVSLIGSGVLLTAAAIYLHRPMGPPVLLAVTGIFWAASALRASPQTKCFSSFIRKGHTP